MEGAPAVPPEDTNQPNQESGGGWPARQAYFVTVEWLDQPHQPEQFGRTGLRALLKSEFGEPSQ